MKAEIITIGDEILIGQVVDTNSAWIGEQLNLNGIEIHQITSIHDDLTQILEAFENAKKYADLVLITGGLGPTKDDITKKALCDYFECNLVLNEQVLEHVTSMLSRRNVSINQLNRDQALVPEACTVLHNPNGTAPGMWFEKDDTIFVSMPGVPFEMKELMQLEILPRLRENGKLKSIYHQTIHVHGVPESMLAEKIEHWEDALPSFIKLAYLPDQLTVRLRLSAYGTDMNSLKKEVDEQIQKLQKIIPNDIVGYNGDSLASVTGELLKKYRKTLALAESCTGGNIAHFLTSNAGSSAYFLGSIVAYANAVKINQLGVSPETLEKYGAVSKNVAEEMAVGVKRALGSDYAISTTGIAGPDGGTDEKPVGTVWIAIAGQQNVYVKRYNFAHNRERNILRFTQAAINFLRQTMLTENDNNHEN
ncbi:competence/damage-inducible protein A [Sunxiuqinia sp. A32]|uniref:competence/damage-inducible protein A n=1 Tax=Sunxiuqinia sp. A32 TaxID=3461496 RepID=UPI004045B0DB